MKKLSSYGDRLVQVATKKSKKRVDPFDEADCGKREALFDLLNKLGIKSAPAIYWEDAIMANFGKPDTMYMDPFTLKAYEKAFGKKKK